MIVGSLLNRKRALHICKKKPVYSQKRPTKKPDSCSAPEGQELLLACTCLHTYTHGFQHLPHTHTQPPTHPPTHARTHIHIFTHTDLRSQRNRATPLPPLLSPFPLTPKHTHSRCTHLLCDQKDPPPSLPFNTHKTHEAQMSSVLKEPYLSSLGTHVNESWHTRS